MKSTKNGAENCHVKKPNNYLAFFNFELYRTLFLSYKIVLPMESWQDIKDQVRFNYRWDIGKN